MQQRNYSYNGVVIATVASTSDKDDDPASVTVISGAAVGILILLTIIIIIIAIVFILCRRRRKYHIDHNSVELSHLPQQHTDNTPGQSLHHVITLITVTSCDHTDSNVLHTGKQDPTTKQETTNALYIPTKVKSID